MFFYLAFPKQSLFLFQHPVCLSNRFNWKMKQCLDSNTEPSTKTPLCVAVWLTSSVFLSRTPSPSTVTVFNLTPYFTLFYTFLPFKQDRLCKHLSLASAFLDLDISKLTTLLYFPLASAPQKCIWEDVFHAKYTVKPNYQFIHYWHEGGSAQNLETGKHLAFSKHFQIIKILWERLMFWAN